MSVLINGSFQNHGSDKCGCKAQFDRNWAECKEAQYNHWVSQRPGNQIQLAFRNHWKVFSELLNATKGGKCLEVGCGRGTISSYFVENRYSCVLLDSSKSVLNTAKEIFAKNSHEAEFVHGDANNLPFDDESFDVVVSIGLLEHFEDVKKPIYEQIRVLRSGGTFLGYIVPERRDNIQKYFRPINSILKMSRNIMRRQTIVNLSPKHEIFRSNLSSCHYVDVLKDAPVRDIKVMGMYPLPMISHSPEFPFSLMSPAAEYILTRLFEAILCIRKGFLKRNPWICRESLGQAFLLTFRKD